MSNNSMLEDAKRATPTIEKDNGKEVLVKRVLIDYIKGTCDELDEAFARIPVILKENGLEAYDNEKMHRAILREGFPAIEEAVFNHTIDCLKNTGLFPKLQREMARRNTKEIPASVKPAIDALLSDISGFIATLREIDFDIESLWFRSGKLRVPPKCLEDITPRFTVEVTRKERQAIEKMREAVTVLKGIKEIGVPYRLIETMADGHDYTDAELLGRFHGISLSH